MLGLPISVMAQSSSSTTAIDVHELAEISKASAMADPYEMKSRDGLVYEVQIFALADALKTGDPRLKGLEHVYSYEHDGLIKYTWGRTRLPLEAARLQREMRRNGFRDAFVVAYYDGKRISPAEANKLRRK